MRPGSRAGASDIAGNLRKEGGQMKFLNVAKSKKKTGGGKKK